MLKSSELHEAAYEWIKSLPCGRLFRHTDTYRFLEENFPSECGSRGDSKIEPRYKNDARWATEDAIGKNPRKDKIAERVGHGEYRRL
jgi:hypothetical protein